MLTVSHLHCVSSATFHTLDSNIISLFVFFFVFLRDLHMLVLTFLISFQPRNCELYIYIYFNDLPAPCICHSALSTHINLLSHHRSHLILPRCPSSLASLPRLPFKCFLDAKLHSWKCCRNVAIHLSAAGLCRRLLSRSVPLITPLFLCVCVTSSRN